MNALLERFLAHASTRPEQAALIMGSGATTTYGELAARSGRRAVELERSGIHAGDIVLVARGVSPALYETLLALFRLGAVAMFPEPAAGLSGVRHAVRAAGPAGLIGGWPVRVLQPFIAELRALANLPKRPATASAAPPKARNDRRVRADGPVVATAAESPALMTFTSGSTGQPKGIVRSVEFLLLQHELLERIRHTQPDDVDLISLPVFILSNLAAGATSVIPAGRLSRPSKLDGRRLREQMVRHQVTRLVAPPAVCERVVRAEGPALPSIKAVFTGGGPVFSNLLHALHKAMPQAAIHAVYGSTEAEPIAAIRFDEIKATDFEAMARGGGLLAGHPIPEAQVRVEDDELWVSGPHVNPGYLDPADDRHTKVHDGAQLWHRTGDAVRVDTQGRLWLLGRLCATADGLYPFAFEAAALGWPGVRQAALLVDGERRWLALAGERLDMELLRNLAQPLGEVTVVAVRTVPMDKRHNSKVDYPRLRQLLAHTPNR
ncbi:MAG: AMP-binding protein [Pseudomonadota bacterium]